MRRAQWRTVSLDELLEDTELPEWPLRDQRPASDPDRAALQAEVWNTIREVIADELTPMQRRALRAIAFDGVPLDEVVRYFQSNRNAIYKLVHDARRKLKARLEARGFGVDDVLNLFSGEG